MDGFVTYRRVSSPKGDTFSVVGDAGTTDWIFVVDTETTGLEGAPADLVVDIGICRVSLSSRTVEDVYSSVLGYDTGEWDDRLKGAWIFENTDLGLDDVESARPALDVIGDVRRILRRQPVTSYNTAFDFGKFLYKEPWSLQGWFLECQDIMLAATDACKLPSEYYGRSYRYPKLDAAYSKLVEGDPAGIRGHQDHRALSDARMASHVMIALSDAGLYRP